MRSVVCVVGTVLAGMSVALPQVASANPSATYSGVVSGTWSNPVLSGNEIDGATGIATLTNNTGSADCSIGGCPTNTNPAGSNSTINWGSAPGNSTITFAGLPFTNQSLDTTFKFGTLTYTNGTSAAQTLIFGATLTLSFGNAAVTDLSVPLGLVTTNNTGTDQQNADFVDFRPVLANTFNVVEGGTAIADVFGHLTGDPMPVIDFIQLDPASPPGAGFVGTGVPSSVPEPMSVALLTVGLLGLGATRRQRS